jgi:hypothetical protein
MKYLQYFMSKSERIEANSSGDRQGDITKSIHFSCSGNQQNTDRWGWIHHGSSEI